MKRRNFIRMVPSGMAVLGSMNAFGAPKPNRPNILFIITDQQFADVMSCVIGKEYLHTPNMDSLAENGMRFTRAYSPNPLCMPMRTSTFTGSFPHQTTIQRNGGMEGFNPSNHLFMGKIFKDAGYETAYFGKWHIALEESEKEIHGFDEFTGEKAGKLDATPIAQFLRKKHQRPFLAVASFLGPHEICQWARKQNIPGEQLGDVPPLNQRPPLLKNAEPPENETDSIALMRKSYHNTSTFPVGNYTEDDWRRLIWGYYRLVERVDGYIGTALDALRESGQEHNTVVLFLSDHGDCHGAHKWNQKTVFYDESARIPLIVSWKGVTPTGTSDVLVNIGTDVIPTFCDFAGIETPSNLPGKSIRKPALGQSPEWKRDYVVVQNCLAQGGPVDGVKPVVEGRMVRSDKFKYCLYSHGKHRESLVDMENDPGEMKNLARLPEYTEVLAQHRAMLEEHGKTFGDQLALDMLNPDYFGAPFGKPAEKKEKDKKNKKR